MSASWGNLFKPEQASLRYLWRGESLPDNSQSLLAVGNRRSYGDVCICDGGTVVCTNHLNRFIHFDSDLGILRCDSGTTLLDIARVVLPGGWFLPVTPGTSYVTVGGAVANDVHGKNHHRVGAFGGFVRSLGLRRSSGEEMSCSAGQNREMFSATIGGLGLTGLISWVEISLLKVSSGKLNVTTESFESIDRFIEISNQAHLNNQYCVSWIDCASGRAGACRGVFFKADHSVEDASKLNAEQFDDPSGPTIPAIFGKAYPLVNPLSVRAFNQLYWLKNKSERSFQQPMFKYFYPLDALKSWNRVYGKAGFYQFQCVVPTTQRDAIDHLLSIIRRSGQGSFLSVLKIMGGIESVGLLSFSRPGITLALDFPNRGERTRSLLSELESVVVEANGALYPAKDSVMKADSFRKFYPRWEEMRSYKDPAFSSSFWRRVTGEE